MIVSLPITQKDVEDLEVFTSDGLFNVSPFVAPQDDSRELLTTTERDMLNLYQEAVDLDLRCADYTLKSVDETNLIFKDNGRISFRPSYTDGFTSNVPISDFALGQLCAKLGVPKKYLERCLKENPPLASENMNNWIEDYGKDLFIRTCDNEVRGVLSSKYSVFDTPDILKSLIECYDFSGFKVKGVYLSPERFHARFVMPRTLDIPMEDDLMPGIQIDSSDVGRSVLKVQFMVYKQVCTNGLIIPQKDMGGVLFTQKHLGISRDEFISEFKTRIDSLPEIIAQHTSLIKHAKIKSLTAVQDTEMMLQLSNSLQKGTALPEDSVKRVLNTVKNEVYGAPTVWTLVNALTEEAQNFTLEKRLDIEKFAGSLLLSA